MISLGEFLSSNTADFFDSDKVRERQWQVPDENRRDAGAIQKRRLRRWI